MKFDQFEINPLEQSLIYLQPTEAMLDEMALFEELAQYWADSSILMG